VTAPASVAELPEVPPVLTGDGLVLRPWADDDADGVLVIARDPATQRWSPSLRAVDDLAGARAWIERRRDRRTDWAVIDQASGGLAGRVGLHHFDAQDRVAEIGYGVAPPYRRKGVAARMVRAVAAYGFTAPPDGLGLHRVVLNHAVDNVGSCRVAWAAGFAPEGVARGALDDGAGAHDDVHVHGRLATDPDGPLPRVVPADVVEVVAGAYQLVAADPDRDAPAVLAAFNDPLTRTWNQGATDLEGARAWCRRRAAWTDGDHASWIVRGAVGGDLLASVSLFDIDARNGCCQVGYWTVPAARGRGIAPAALSAATRFAFDALGLERVELFHGLENAASCRVADKAGFALEGVLRLSHRYGDGELHDEHLHGRLAGD
jgi:RimJ/RimL family protein N-acetyltransferase